MVYLWSSLSITGAILALWAELSLPKGTNLMPVPPKTITKKGPYRFVQHPMYIGNVAVLSGFAGLGGGIWNALAVGFLAKMVMQHWAGLEKK